MWQDYAHRGVHTPSLYCRGRTCSNCQICTPTPTCHHRPPCKVITFLKRCDTGSCSVSATCTVDDMQWPKDGCRVLTCLCWYVRSSVFQPASHHHHVAWPNGASPVTLNRRTGGLVEARHLGRFYDVIVASEVCHELTKKHTAAIRRMHRVGRCVNCDNWTRDPPTKRSIFTSGQRRRGYKADKIFLLALPHKEHCNSVITRHWRSARRTTHASLHLNIVHSLTLSPRR